MFKDRPLHLFPPERHPANEQQYCAYTRNENSKQFETLIHEGFQNLRRIVRDFMTTCIRGFCASRIIHTLNQGIWCRFSYCNSQRCAYAVAIKMIAIIRILFAGCLWDSFIALRCVISLMHPSISQVATSCLKQSTNLSRHYRLLCKKQVLLVCYVASKRLCNCVANFSQ